MSASLLDQHPDTLLNARETAPILHYSYNTLTVNVTRSPELLPAITRRGRCVFFRVGDIKEHLAKSRTPTPAPLRARVRKELSAHQ